MVLCLVTYSLCVFGTFLTRSGLVSSVHAFSKLENIMASPIFLFIVLLEFFGLVAAVLMMKRCSSPRPAEFTPCKSTAQTYALYLNYLMVVLTFVIFVGTLYPFFSRLTGHEEITLEPAYFNKITAPGGLVLILFIAVCPYLWRYGLKIGWRLGLAALAFAATVVFWFVTKTLAPGIGARCHKDDP